MTTITRKEPKISVITVTFNAERYLEQTIKSISAQTYRRIEYIVIDGGSTDSTLNILKKHKNNIDHIVSEPDHGIADAMNKGINLASGDYIIFLHSDDYLVDPKALENAAQFLNPSCDIYVFKVLLDDGNNQKLSANRSLDWRTNFKMGSCHQGQICSTELYRRIGGFDTNFSIDMDYDFILRAYRANAQSSSINRVISVMRLVGISSRTSWTGLQQRFEEERKAHKKNCPNRWLAIVYKYYWAVYLPYRKIRSNARPFKTVSIDP